MFFIVTVLTFSLSNDFSAFKIFIIFSHYFLTSQQANPNVWLVRSERVTALHSSKCYLWTIIIQTALLNKKDNQFGSKFSCGESFFLIAVVLLQYSFCVTNLYFQFTLNIAFHIRFMKQSWCIMIYYIVIYNQSAAHIRTLYKCRYLLWTFTHCVRTIWCHIMNFNIIEI